MFFIKMRPAQTDTGRRGEKLLSEKPECYMECMDVTNVVIADIRSRKNDADANINFGNTNFPVVNAKGETPSHPRTRYISKRPMVLH